jgi:aminomethyltransferase
VVPNAANIPIVLRTLEALAGEARERGEDVEVEDVSDDWGILALQGPRWQEVSSAVLPGVNPARFRVEHFRSGVGEGVASGTGYTGSPGIEIMAPADTIVGLWDALQSALGAVAGLPAGLGARDTLRLEMGYPLHGHELSPEISPFEAGLGWVVSLDSADFPGARALREQKASGVSRALIGLRGADRRPLRDGCPVRDAAGSQVGSVTSGGYSPILERGIGLAIVQTGSHPSTVDVRGRALPVEPATPPFVDP